MLALVPSEHLSENEIAAAAVADQGGVGSTRSSSFVSTWPAEPVVARAYLDQLERGEELSEALAARAWPRRSTARQRSSRDGAS